MPTKKRPAKKAAPKKRAPAKPKADRVSDVAKAVAGAVARSKKEKAVKKTSAIDAAAKVLAAAEEPLTTGQMIEAMTAQGLWTSPGGKTPDRTLYSAILREIATKGKDARFKKTERGKFSLATK
ncbi:MAG: hypothetical protein KF847_08155 [Pirellulales bacterium]|nr:hypothetical protein [Pirellulales bacterium]